MISRRTIMRGALLSAVVPGVARGKECRAFLPTEEGPFFPRDAIPAANDLTGGAARGEVIYVFGTITGPDCAPLEDAAVAIWQTDDAGEYRHPNAGRKTPVDPNFLYFARQAVGPGGFYWFKTVVPQPYVFAGLRRARHIHFEVSHPEHGRMTSEMYFAGAEEDARRDGDFVWKQRDAAGRDALIVEKKAPSPYAGPTLAFDLDAPFCNFDLSFARRG